MNKGNKITGGKYHKLRKKRSHERGRQERVVTLGDYKNKILPARGGNSKAVLLKSNIANLKTDKKTEVVKIINVEATPQNHFLARQNRLMKGAIIETEKGKAKITNRPSQEGQINAVLVKK